MEWKDGCTGQHPQEHQSSANRNAILSRQWTRTSFFGIFGFTVSVSLIIYAGPPIQITGFLDGAAAESDRARMATNTAWDGLSLRANATSITRGWVIGTRRGSSEVRNIFGVWMLGTNVGHTNVGGLASLAESIISGIEVFTFLG